MIIPIPTDFKEVEPDAFQAFLNCCADYTSQCNANVRAYTFRHNDRRFAYEDREGRVFVDPKLLEPLYQH